MRAVFFDLDDTLIHTTGTRRRRMRLAFETLSAAVPSLDRRWFYARVQAVDPASGWLRGVGAVVEELGLAHTEAGRRAAGLWFYEGCLEILKPHSGARRAIRSLTRDYRLGVITNGPGDLQRRKFGVLDLADRFEVFIASEEVGHHKPDPRIFQFALAKLGVDPQEALLVGDLPHVDVLGAQSAGMRGVWFNRKGQPAPDGIVPDATIRSLAELPGLVRSW